MLKVIDISPRNDTIEAFKITSQSKKFGNRTYKAGENGQKDKHYESQFLWFVDIIVQVAHENVPNSFAEINGKVDGRVRHLICGVDDVEVSKADEEVDHKSEEKDGGLPNGFSPDDLLLIFNFLFCHYLDQVFFVVHMDRVILLGLNQE